MTESDRPAFVRLIADVCAYYSKDCSPFVLNVWWENMKRFDYVAVKDAMNRHPGNPDSGQFMPKPGDIVKALEGSTSDKAVVAWAEVVKAISAFGPYRSVEFADPRIAVIVNEMGGWIKVCEITNDELPFRQREFENRYRAMVNTSEVVPPSGKVMGLIEQDHVKHSLPAPDIAIPQIGNVANKLKSIGFVQ